MDTWNNNILWHHPPQTVSLQRDVVHVWHSNVQSHSGCYETLKRHLSPDEIVRADRFHFRKDRDRFIIARGKLRIILSRYLNIEPREVSFQYDEFGKPFLVSNGMRSPLQFNVSHSNEVAIFAVAWNRAIGIDVECKHPISEAHEISARFFSRNETILLRSLPGDRRLEVFFRFWARKEAYAKALGDGLTRPLDQFDTSSFPDAITDLIPIHVNNQIPCFCIMDIGMGSNYVAAIVIEGQGVTLEFWQEPVVLGKNLVQTNVDEVFAFMLHVGNRDVSR